MAEEIKEKPARKKFQMPNTYVILFAVIAFIALLTWFVPGGAYELSEGGDAIAGTYHVVESNPQGLWDIFMAPITGMLGGGTVSGAISISLTIMLFGSLLEMMDRTCALKTAIKRITIANQNNMHALIAILVILMAFFGTLEGAYEEGIVYFLMFVPVILALGLDTVTAIMIVVLGTQIGCLSSIINPFSTGIASGIAGISPGEGMIPRIAMFVIFTGLVILLICRYADKIKAHPEKSVQFFRREQDLKEFPAADDEDLSQLLNMVFSPDGDSDVLLGSAAPSAHHFDSDDELIGAPAESGQKADVINEGLDSLDALLSQVVRHDDSMDEDDE